MKWFNNLKVAYKVMLSCAILISLLITAIFFSITSLRSTRFTVTDYKNNEVKSVVELDTLLKDIMQGRINMFEQIEAIGHNDSEKIKKLLDDNAQLLAEAIPAARAIEERAKTPEEKELTDKFNQTNMVIIRINSELIEAVNSRNDMLINIKMKEWTDQFQIIKKIMKELHALILKNGEEKINLEFSHMNNTIIYMLLILIFSFTAGIIITKILSDSVSKPVKLGLAFAQKIADGDLTERIELQQKDELGMLAKALNKAADNLEKLVSNVNMSVNNLTMAVTDISTGNQNLSQRTTEQASSLEEIASTLEEATATIRQTADNTIEANTIADSSTKLAVNGGTIVEETVGSINRISESGKKIGEIIAVINEIAFQTNLLALNAAVEAARAGDQGRGFAVVASEVRNLAQRAGSSAKEIEALIKESLENINQGTTLVTKSGVALRELIISVKEVGRIISEVTASTEEQRQGIDQINTAVMDLDTMTQQNAALVEETASASEEMAAQAGELMELMKQFKVRDNTGLIHKKAAGQDIKKEVKKDFKPEPVKKPKTIVKNEPAIKHEISGTPELKTRPVISEKTETKTDVTEKRVKSPDKGIKKHLEDEGFEAF